MTKYWYRPHETGTNPRMRVWLDGWTSDMSEVLSYEDFIKLRVYIDMVNDLSKRLGLGVPIQLHKVSED